MPTVTTDDGAQIFYKDWGSDGSPVILSHGWPLNADAWEAAALFLAEHGHRAIAHDRRGHGRSTQTWDGNEMDTYADDLATLIETLDLRDLTLVGHSTGGGEIVHYVGRHGSDRVAKLVLVSAVPPLMLRDRRQPRRACRSRSSTGSGAGEAADRSQLYRDLADGPFFGHNRNNDVAQGFRDAFWLQGMACGHRGRLRVHRRVLGHRLPARPRQDRRPDPRHPRRRRPDRPVRGRRQAVRRDDRPAPCSRSTRAAPTACPTPNATGCTPTCSTSSTPETKEPGDSHSNATAKGLVTRAGAGEGLPRPSVQVRLPVRRHVTAGPGRGLVLRVVGRWSQRRPVVRLLGAVVPEPVLTRLEALDELVPGLDEVAGCVL